MILVYNETRHPWIVKEMPEKQTLRIMKHNERTLVHRKTTEDVPVDKLEKHGTIGILAYANSVQDTTEFANNLSLSTAMTSFSEVSDKPVSVTFNRKEMRPVITPDGQDRTIILLSLPIKYRKLISFSTKGIHLLRQSCLRGEFSACLSVVNYQKMKVRIEFLAREKNSVDVIQIESAGDGSLPTITKKSREARDEDIKISKEGFTPSEYRPLRPTNLIFVKKDKMHLLPRLNREQFTIMQLTGEESQLKSVIKMTRSRNFRAVTYFSGQASTDVKDSILANDDDKIIDTLTKNFAHVNSYYSDKVVVNIKK